MDQADKLDYDVDFLSGICCLCESDYKQARQFFLAAVYNSYLLDRHYAVYQSYLALSDVLTDYQNEILDHCYHSTDDTIANEPEVQLNLACAELLKGDRRRAFEALGKLSDFKLHPKRSEELHSFFDIVGTRKKNNRGTLKRNNFIHKFIGKIFRKKATVSTVEHIEEFIKETARKRYEWIMFSI